MSTYDYYAFGLNVRSELSLPEFLSAAFTKPDVEITYAPVQKSLENKIYSRPRTDVGETSVLLRIPAVGRFLIENGRRINVQPEQGAEPAAIRLFLLGSCFGALLHQRGITPMHGSAVAGNNGAIIICGDSGVGKSTTATALRARGYQILTDDIAALSIKNDAILLIPGYPQLKLWQNSMDHFGLQTADYHRVRAKDAKYAIPIPGRFSSTPTPVHALVWLRKQDIVEPALRLLEGSDRFEAVHKNVYRKKFALSASPYDRFYRCQCIAEKLICAELARSQSCDNIDTVADLVEARYLQSK